MSINARSRFIDLTGAVYGRLRVVSFIGRIQKHSVWECLCTCGNSTEVRANNLRTGHTKSCGCLEKENQRIPRPKHGGTAGGKRSRTYQTWRCMRERCTLPSNASFKFYGGRGIKVCPEWDNFKVFLQDMGERPEGKTLDRINPAGNYCKSNCRWADLDTQMKNRRPRGKNK